MAAVAPPANRILTYFNHMSHVEHNCYKKIVQGIEQRIAEEFLGEGTLVSSVSDFTSFPVDVNVVDDGKEQNASPSGRGDDIPKVAKTNILPSAHKVLNKKPKKGLLQQKKREILNRDISESGEEKSISSVDEDDERIVPTEDEKYVGGEVDPKVAKLGVMLGAQKVFDKRPLPKPVDHIKRAEVKKDQDPFEPPSTKGCDGLPQSNSKKTWANIVGSMVSKLNDSTTLYNPLANK
ncbi:hypothetical protein U1Q18_028035 [Sarracenia purpurea var. burkii]